MTARDAHGNDSWGDDSTAEDQAAESSADDGSAFEAFDAYTVVSDDYSGLDQLDPFAGSARFVDDGDDLDALRALDAPTASGGDDDDLLLISATNPPGTVTVTAHLTGGVHRIELAPAVTSSTELDLANQIRAVADVASKKASSMMHGVGVELLTAQGLDLDAASKYVSEISPFADPAQVRAAEEALAARFSGGA